MVAHRISLPYPPSANDYWVYVRGRVVPSKTAAAYKMLVARLAAGMMPLVGEVVGEFVLYRPRKAGDLGNRLKVVEDALQGHAYLDDAQISEYRVFKRLEDPDNPRVELVYEGMRFATRQEVEEQQYKRAKSAAQRRASFNKRKLLKKMAGRHGR